ncbi:MAG: N-6 DNA methylase [Phycisphaerales bacterium JB052]
MFEQTFKNIDDVLWKDEGCDSELDYAEQTAWILFLKYLDDLESERSAEAELAGKTATPIFDPDYRWSTWAAPKTASGEFDYDAAKTGDDLINFVNAELFPYLQSFKQTAEDPDTIEYKIGAVFADVKQRISSGYVLRDVLELADQLRFNSQAEKHELGDLYETRIKNMGNAGRTGGQYYTPRPLIRTMIRVIDPKIGETIYDPACGSGGFLCEGYEYLRPKAKSTKALATLQTMTFHGKEKKSLAYALGIMNSILHGIDVPNIVRTNTLEENIADVQPKDQFDIILTNPPFGGKERREVQHNFPIRSGETAFLFMQHFIKRLKPGGRAAVVIKNTFLSNMDNAAKALRKELLESCELHTVLDCPAKTFLGAGVKTVVLFFEKGKPTKDIWFYQLDPGRSLGKTDPLNDDDLAEFVEMQRTRPESEKSWKVSVGDLDAATLDLSPKNPNRPDETDTRTPAEILDEIEALDAEASEVLASIRGML